MKKLKRKDGDSVNTIRVQDATGNEWITEIDWRDSTPVGEPGPDNPNLVVKIQAPGDTEMVSHSRALTPFELADPEFDPEVLVNRLTDRLITEQTTIKENKEKVKALLSKVKKDQPLDLNKGVE